MKCNNNKNNLNDDLIEVLINVIEDENIISYDPSEETCCTYSSSQRENESENKSRWNLYNYTFTLPIAYFITSMTFIFLIIMICFYYSAQHSNYKLPLSPLPSFYTMNTIQPLSFNLGVLGISIIGLINVWFYCSLLLQRFSVPELQSKKMGIHLMLILGILANQMFVLFAFSSNIINIERFQIKDMKISLSTIIFLCFIFFNILYAVVSILSLESLNSKNEINNQNIRRNNKTKRNIVYLSIFVMFLYTTALIIKNHEKKFEINHYPNFVFTLDIILSLMPFLLYFINCFINLIYYKDILNIQENLKIVIDKEYFTDESEEVLLIRI